MLAAIRLAVLPLHAGGGTSGRRRFASHVVLYSWTVAVVGVETGSSTREGGFLVVTVALALDPARDYQRMAKP